MIAYRPTGITANRQTRELIVSWDDGHESRYSFTLLRHACPCAQCRGGHEKMGSELDPDVFSIPVEDTPATQLRSIEQVGTYAITMEWEDGHHYGIYNWGTLRALCACPKCRGGSK